MKSNHIELIRKKKKTTTLRSLKEIYPLGVNELEDGCQINITKRELVRVEKDSIFSLDSDTMLYKDRIGKIEGYKDWDSVIKVLKGMRYRFPKVMWLYYFEPFKVVELKTRQNN